jgi:hypothetical protein
MGQKVARIEQGEMRGLADSTIPDFTAFNPGYLLCPAETDRNP